MELHNPDGPNFCITREINLENKSSWKLDGKPATSTQVSNILNLIKHPCHLLIALNVACF